MRRAGSERVSLGEKWPVRTVAGWTWGCLGEIDRYEKKGMLFAVYLGSVMANDGKVMVVLDRLEALFGGWESAGEMGLIKRGRMGERNRKGQIIEYRIRKPLLSRQGPGLKVDHGPVGRGDPDLLMRLQGGVVAERRMRSVCVFSGQQGDEGERVAWRIWGTLRRGEAMREMRDLT
jgi:hypothetical protein